MNTNSLLLKIPETAKLELLKGPILPNEGMHLAYLASLVPKGGIIVELGTLRGKSACYMGTVLRYTGNQSARVHCVDLWTLGGPTQQKNHGLEKQWAWYKKNRADFRLENWLIPHMAESVEFSKSWQKPIDLLFIDAGHTYEACHADYFAWSGFVKPGGYIAFHDYAYFKWPGVVQVIDTEVIPSQLWECVHIENYLWTARRRE